MNTLARTITVTGLAAGVILGTTVQASADISPPQRIFTLAEDPRCIAGTIDVTVQPGFVGNEIRANFTTHLINPAWSGSADYECYVNIRAAWHNLETDIRGTAEHRVASWRFQGPNVADPYMDIDTGSGPVVVTFTTDPAHAPSPTFEVRAG